MAETWRKTTSINYRGELKKSTTSKRPYFLIRDLEGQEGICFIPNQYPDFAPGQGELTLEYTDRGEGQTPAVKILKPENESNQEPEARTLERVARDSQTQRSINLSYAVGFVNSLIEAKVVTNKTEALKLVIATAQLFDGFMANRYGFSQEELDKTFLKVKAYEKKQDQKGD